MASFILGAIVGFLLAVLMLYWQQINSLYQNRGVIEGANQVVSGLQQIGVKI